MGALAAAVAKDGKNVVPKVVQMLKVLEHRGKDAHGIAANNSSMITQTIKEMTAFDIKSEVALGQNFVRIVPTDTPQPIQDGDFALVFEGRLFPPFGKSGVKDTVKMFRSDPEGAERLIDERDGSYVFAFSHESQIVVGRDPVGAAPLYYGESMDLYGLASERKALWALGISDVKSFPPGNLAIIDRNGASFRSVKAVTKPPTRHVGEATAIKELRKLLSESTKERTADSERIAIAFSGGLDSSLVASFAKECGTDISLISVGLEGQPELQHAEAVAETLGLPFKAAAFTLDDVEKVFPEVLWLVEEPSILKVSVAIPFFWASETASKLGYSVLLAAQGSDELFGGYSRYLREYKMAGVGAVEDALFRDTVLSYETNLERDNKACAFHNVELRLPFIDRDLIALALSLPLNLKIESSEDPLRKRILRKLAKNIGLPPTVYEKPKKAVQYTTGVDKALRKLAQRKGKGLQELLEQSFATMRRNSEPVSDGK